MSEQDQIDRAAKLANDASLPEEAAPDRVNGSVEPQAKPMHTVRALNVPLLIGTIILVGVVGPAAYFWHQYKLRDTATFLLTLADEAEADSDWRKAADYLQRYLRLLPDDVPRVMRLAQTFDKSATSYAEKQRAVSLFYSTIGTVGGSAFPKEVPALRGRLIELLLDVQRYGAAEVEAVKLLEQLQSADSSSTPSADQAKLQALAWRSLAFARLGLFESGVRVIPVNETTRTVENTNASDASGTAAEPSPETPAADAGATGLLKAPVGGVRVAWEPDAIGPTFVQALKLNPAHIELARQMAFVCRERPQIGLYHDRVAEPAAATTASPEGKTPPQAPPQPLTQLERDALADATMDRMVQENPANVRALLARFAYYDRLAKPQPDDPADLPPEVVEARQAFALKAYTDLSDALKKAPTDLDVCLTAAQHASAALDALGKGPNRDAAAWKTHFDEAEKYLRQAISTAPADPRPYQELGKLFLKDNQRQSAIEVFRDGLAKADKRDLELNCLLLDALIGAGQAAEAGNRDNAEKVSVVDTVQDLWRRLSPNLTRVAQLDLQKRTDLLLGRWHVAMGQFAEAIPLLSRVNTLSDRVLPADQPFRLLSSFLLGVCHANLGQWEQATGFLDAATALAPTWAEAHALAAEAWTKCGQPEQVAIHLEQAARLNDSAELWFKLAQARLQAQLRVLPRELRDFTGVDAALQEAIRPDREKPLSDPWRAGLLQVEYLLVRSLDDAARQSAVVEAKSILSQLEQKHPDSAVLWRAIAYVYQQLNDTAAADRAVNRFAELQLKGPDSYVLRSQILAARRQYQPARDVLIEGIKAGLSSADVNVLSQALVGVSLSEGNRTLATSELKGLLKSEPDNVAILQQLAELAFEQQDFKQVEECEKKLNDLGSKGNSFAAMLAKFQRARRVLAASESTTDPQFAEGQRIVEELQRERPGWAPALLLSALAYQRLGENQKAIGAYEEAIRLGERRLAVYEQLIKVLIVSAKFPEAQEYLAQLREFVPNVGELSALDVASRLGQGKDYFDRALDSARLAVQARPNDPAAHLLLGQTLIAVNKQAEGEVSLKRALELKPADLRANASLFELYRLTGRTDNARQLMVTLSSSSPDEVPVNILEPFLAQAFERLGDRAEALLHLERAQTADPNNMAVVLRRATLLANEKPEEVKVLLRKAMEMAPQDDRPRRGLAAILATSGSEADWEEAQRLIASSGDPAADLGDQRVKAILLAQRGGLKNLLDARGILEPLVKERDANPGDRLILARVCEAQASQLLAGARQAAVAATADAAAEVKRLREEAEKSYQSAESQYVELANTSDATRKVDNLTAYVEFLLRQNDPEKYAELENRLKQLKDVADNPLALATLQVRYLKAVSGAESIGPQVAAIVEPVAKKLVDETDKASDSPELIARAQSQLALTIANIYLSAEQSAAAEPWLRKALDKNPEAYGQLAVCLAAEGRVQDAVQLCLAAAKSDPSPQAVRTLASTLVLGTATSADFELAEPVFAKALSDFPSDAGLISNLADIRVVQGRVDEAIGLYEKALALQPKSVMLLNNLATLLGEQPTGRDKALEYVDKAIQLAGAVPGLLDTKGMVFFSAGDFAKAKEWLEVATWDLGTDPRFFFHLAAACHRLGDAAKARENFQHAQKNQLDRQVLTPADQALLSELKQAYSS